MVLFGGGGGQGKLFFISIMARGKFQLIFAGLLGLFKTDRKLHILIISHQSKYLGFGMLDIECAQIESFIIFCLFIQNLLIITKTSFKI